MERFFQQKKLYGEQRYSKLDYLLFEYEIKLKTVFEIYVRNANVATFN